MSKKRKLLIIGLVIVLSFILLINMFLNEGGTNKEYQHDADIVRMRDLIQISNYLEQYNDIQGYYPYTNYSDIPVYVFIGTEEQRKYVKNEPTYEYEEISVTEFKSELERVLNKEVLIPHDPQNAPTNKPNIYLYMAYGDYYYLAVHLHNEFTFTKKIDDYYNKLEISNNPNSYTWDLNKLKENEDFLDAINEELYKEGYFYSE